MAHKLQIKRGNKADLPALSEGEFGLCQDTQELYIGNNGNKKMFPSEVANVTGLQTALDGKVNNSRVLTDVPAGAKFTDTVTTVNGKTGAISKADIVALGIPAQDTVVDISGKADKVDGKGLSTEDYTTVEKTKLAGIADNANNYSHPATHPASMITQTASNRFVSDTEKSTWSGKLDASHAGEQVDSSNGVHGLRWYDSKLQYDNGTGWAEIETGGGGGLLPHIIVTVDSGSTVTATCGDKTVTGTSIDGTCTLEVPNYGIWTVTATLNGKTSSTTIDVEDVQIYKIALAYSKQHGVRWDRISKTVLSRLGDAALFTDPTPCVGSTAGNSPFDACYPWSDIKLCNVVNGAVTAYQGGAGFSRTPASGDVMVEIPKFWYKIVNTPGGNLDIYIADGPLEGYSASPAHCDRGDGKGERDKVYVGAYTSNSNYRSISGNASLVEKTRADFRSGHAGRGAGYCTIDFATWWTIAMLYFVEYASTDSQSSVGRGYVDGNSAQINTGGANSIGGGDTASHHTGTAGSSIGANAAIKYRHMENLWGNIYWFVDGIVFSDTAVHICLNPANFGDITANHTNLGITRANASGYISDLAVPSNYPWAMYPSSTNGSEATFIPDRCYYGSSGVVLCVGGGWNDASGAGLVCLYGDGSAAFSAPSIGSRLLVLP